MSAITPKLLSQLFAGIIAIDAKWERTITGVTQDSRLVKPGYVFFAIMGHDRDGRDYIDDAISHGAVAVICDAAIGIASVSTITTIENRLIPIFTTPQLERKLGIIASRFFESPSRDVHIFGITGTNGKTSCVNLLADILQRCQPPCGIMGTIGNGFPGNLSPSSHTTLDAVTLQSTLQQLVTQGAKKCVMEVSSHGLDQGRLEGVQVDTAVFTNLTRDHLDYHKDFIAYGNAKKRLFYMPSVSHAIINVDDPFGCQLALALQDKIKVTIYSTQGAQADFSHLPQVYAQSIELHTRGITSTIQTPKGEVLINVPLYGRFNVSNLLAVVACLLTVSVPLDDLANLMQGVMTVPGRMQRFGGDNRPQVFVDYAHTPDAVEKALCAVREHYGGRIMTIFGCGGNRDSGKRPFMGRIVERLSDEVIITNDNPRYEDANKIAQDILSGFEQSHRATLQLDRKKAITQGIRAATPNDVVLVLGKGHEDYQEIGGQRFVFSDKEQVLSALDSYIHLSGVGYDTVSAGCNQR